MEDYASNSHASREKRKEPAERKKLDKVVSGKVSVKKKSWLEMAVKRFIIEDPRDIKDKIIDDVVIPNIKGGLSDVVDVIFGGRSYSSSRSGASKISYWTGVNGTKSKGPSEPRERTGYRYDDFIFETKGEATVVLDALEAIIEQYQVVSIADLYDVCDITNNNYTDCDYGWDNLRNARIVRTMDGRYELKMPRAIPLKK